MKDRTGKQLSHQEIIAKGIQRADSVLNEFALLVLHIVGSLPSHHLRRFFYRLSGIKIGKGSTIHTGARFYETQKIKIGNDTIVGEGVVLDGRDAITIGDHVAIATGVMIYNAEHDLASPYFDPIHEPVVINDYVFIGPRAIILPGVTIGKGAVVGAGAVVTKNVDEYSVVGGVPAKEIKKRPIRDLSYKIGRASWFR